MKRKPVKGKPPVGMNLLCRILEIKMPEMEFRFHPKRKWRMDFAWPDHKIALEVEGAVWTRGRHTRGAGFLKDIQKYNTAVEMGWRILRCTPSTLCEGVGSVKRTMEGINE